MGNSSFFEAPNQSFPLGPQLLVAPSSLSFNSVAPSPPSLTALLLLAGEIANAADYLRKLLDEELPEVTKGFAGAIAAMRAIVGVADAMDETLAFRTVAGGPPAPNLVAKARTLKQKAHALFDASIGRTGGDVDPRATIQDLDERVRTTSGALMSLLRDPANVAVVKTFVDDKSISVTTKYIEMWGFSQIQTHAINLLARTERGDECDRIAQEIFQQDDRTQSVPAISIAEGKTLWGAFVATATMATGLVGNLPAPDSLSITLLKVYAARRMPKVASNQAAAGNLEREIFGLLVKSVKLTPEQKNDLEGRVDELKIAQREVIRRAKEEIETAKRLPDHEARILRKTRQRVQAEEACKVKAENVEKFYEGTYGPENEAMFGAFQRGPFMDGFVTVLTFVQLCAAWKELDDPDVSTAQKFADVSTTGLLTLGAVVATVGKHIPSINLGVAKVNLAAAGKFFEALQKPFALYAGVMAMISGTALVIDGFREHDAEKEWIGAITITYGALITYGVLAGSLLASGVGVGISVLLAGYMAFTYLADTIKNPTEKVIESILDSLEKKKIYRDKTAVDYLGVTAQLKEVRSALDGWVCVELVRNPKGAPTRADLIARMTKLGFGEEIAKSLIESEEDESARNNPIPWTVSPLGM